MKKTDAILKRALKRDGVMRLLDSMAGRDPLWITGQDDGPIYGGTPEPGIDSAEIVADGAAVGTVHGRSAPQVAQILGLVVEQALEARALAADALEKYKELTMLHQLSEKLFSAAEAEHVTGLIRDELRRHLKCDGISVMLLNDETGRLEIVTSDGDNFHSRSSLDVADDLIGAVLKSGRGEIVNDVAHDARSIEADTVFRSVICSPLKARNRVFGVVIVGTHDPHEYTAGDLQLVNSLASQGAIALEVARLNKALVATTQKPAEVIYGVDDIPPRSTIAMLGLQHALIALISLTLPIVVTLEAGGTRMDAVSLMSMSLIAMSIATFLQALSRPPFGSGYLVNHVTSAIYLAPSLLAVRVGGLGLVFGMTIFAGVFGILFSQLVARYRKVFPPEVSGIIVLMVGLSMIRVALSRFMGLGDGDFVTEPRELIVAFVTIGSIIALTVSTASKLRLYSTLIGIATGFILAAGLGLVDPLQLDAVAEVPLFGVPTRPDVKLSFDALLVIPFIAAALAASLKDAGLVISSQKASDRTWKRPDSSSVSGGIMADAIGNVSSGLLGGVGISVSAGNVGLSIATGALSRVIGVAVALAFLAFAFMPKVIAGIALMPSPVIGAGLIYVACYLMTSGVHLIVSRMLDARRTFIIGLAIIGGVGVDVVPEAFAVAPTWLQPFVSSPLALSTTLAVALNLILSIGVSNTARLHLELDQPIRDAAIRFLEHYGAVWGARNDVIQRAAPALTDWCEELRQYTAYPGAEVEMRFDEFRLSMLVRCDGAETTERAPGEEPGGLETILRHIRRRYDCTAAPVSDDGFSAVRIDFVH